MIGTAARKMLQVSLQILCKQNTSYNAQQQGTKWFKSCLCNQKHLCQVNWVSTKIKKINAGVSQGSCPDPFLFHIYTNNLPHAVKLAVTSMYADDTSLRYQSLAMQSFNKAIDSDVIQLDA